MKIFYWLLVFYLSLNLLIYFWRTKKFWSQMAACLVLILFLLRLLSIQ